MKKKRARLLALMLAVSMVVPNGVGANTMETVQAEEADATIVSGYRIINEDSSSAMYQTLIDNATATSQQYNNDKDGLAKWAFDDQDRWWHSNYGDVTEGNLSGNVTTGKVWLQTSFGKSMKIGKIEWVGRTDAEASRIRNYEVWVANNPTNVNSELESDGWIKVAEKTGVTTNIERVLVEFTPQEITHIRIKPLSTGNNTSTAAVKRVYIYEYYEESAVKTALGAKIKEVRKNIVKDSAEFQAKLAVAQEVYGRVDATDEECQEQIDILNAIDYAHYYISDEILAANATANSQNVKIQNGQLVSANNNNDGAAAWAFEDGSRMWHSRYTLVGDNQRPKDDTHSNGEATENEPVWIQTGFGKEAYVSRFIYQGRSEANNVISKYELQVMNENDAVPVWKAIASGEFEQNANEQVVEISHPVKATHVRLVAYGVYTGGSSHVVARRIKFWETTAREVLKNRIDFVEGLVNKGEALTTALAAAQAVYETTADDAKYEAALNELEAARTAATTITVNEKLTLTREDEQTLAATVTSEALFNWERDVEWSTSDASIATVDAKGKVTAVAAGDATITATLRDNENVTASCAVTVEPKKFAITAESANKEQGTVEVIDGTYNEGTEITAKATAKEGFVFTNWTNANGDVVSTAATYEFVVTEAVDLTAHFEVDNQLKLEAFSINGNNNVTLDKECHWSIENYKGHVSSTEMKVTAAANRENATITLAVDGVVKATSENGVLDATVYLPAELGGLSEKDATMTLTVTEGEESKVYTFDFNSVTYLTSIMNLADTSNAMGYTDDTTFLGVNTNCKGNPISLLDEDGTEKVFAKGLGLHAQSTITYDISGLDYDVFEAYAGIDGGQRPSNDYSSVTFKVYVDDVLKYESEELTEQTVMQHVVVNGLANANTLKLVMEKGTNNYNDHANWADAKLTYGEFVASTETVTLDKEALTVIVGETATLTATTTPEDVTEYTNTLTWTSSDENVATVNKGVVTPVAAGTATITVTTEDGNKDTCVVTVKDIVSVSLSSVGISKDSTVQGGIVTLTGGNNYYTGDKVTITAPIKVGYEFKGWYAPQENNAYTGEPLDANYSWTFEATETKELVAVYEATPEYSVSLTVKGIKNNVTIGDKTVTAETLTDGVYNEYRKVGKVTIAYTLQDGETFLYWMNSSGKIVSTNATDEFDLVNNLTLEPVVKSKTQGSLLVEYVNEYDQILSTSVWTQEGTLSTEYPSKLGYDCIGWAFTAGASSETEKIDAAEVWKEDGTGHVKLYPVYVKLGTKFAVNYYDDGTETAKATDELLLGDTCTLTAANVDGKAFSHWEIVTTKGGEEATSEVVSYNKTYTFLVTEDFSKTLETDGVEKVLKAVFVELNEGETVKKESILKITSQYEIMNGEAVEKVAFVASREIAEDYELLEHGMLYARGSALEEATFVEGVAGVGKFTANGTGKKGAFTLNVKLGTAQENIKVRAYAIVKDKDGNVTTLYSNLSTYEVK